VAREDSTRRIAALPLNPHTYRILGRWVTSSASARCLESESRSRWIRLRL